jgi:hypothetical protein
MPSPHKNRHPWRDQDLRSDINRAAGVRPAAPVKAIPPSVRAGIYTLLTNYDEDAAAGRKFTREENTNVASVRAWLES